MTPASSSIIPTPSRRSGEPAFHEFSRIFRDPELVYSRHEILNLETHIARTGEVAWFSALALSEPWVDDGRRFGKNRPCRGDAGRKGAKESWDTGTS